MSAWKLVVVTLAVAVLLVAVEFVWLRNRQEAQHIAQANGQVERKIATARAHMREQHWNEAIHELEDALDVEGATNRDAVDPVLEEARRSQAETLLDAAGIALAHKHPDDALQLLRLYLAHPQAGHLHGARRMRDDLERALSDEEAARLLARLSDEALTILSDQGELTVDDGLQTEAAHPLFQETLRRNMANEIRKRAAQREVTRLTAERRAAERARRIAHLRASPAFHSLSSFLVQTLQLYRDRQRLAAQQEAELRVLFRQLGVKNAAEQKQIRDDLLDHPTTAGIREQIERKRAAVKRAYRNESTFNHADAELFDQFVDYEVDRLLKMLPPS